MNDYVEDLIAESEIANDCTLMAVDNPVIRDVHDDLEDNFTDDEEM